MAIASSDSLARVLSAADGLLASLIFLEATPSAVNIHHCSTIPLAQQNPEFWVVLSHIQMELEDCRVSIVRLLS